MQQNSSKSSGKKISAKPLYPELIGHFFLIYLPILLFILIGFGILDYTLKKSQHQALAARQITKVQLSKKMIYREFDNIVTDVEFLVNSSQLQNYLNSPQEGSLQQLEATFNNLSDSRKIYDQIRFVASNGWEVVRVNYRQNQAVTLTTDQLQNKSSSYYFSDIMGLSAGQIYVSPLDLNIEYGQIEHPLKPTLRFGTPVFDAKGNKRGIVIFNYLGDILLSHIAEFVGNDREHQATAHDEIGHAILLNTEGHWLLSGDDAHQEWGFMFDKKLTFNHYAPAVWQAITSFESGQIETDKGLFTFATVSPLSPKQISSKGASKFFAPSENQQISNTYSWYLISHVDSEQLRKLENFYFLLMLKAAFICAILLSPLCWFLAKVRLQNRNSQQMVILNEQKFRTLADYSHSWESWVGTDGNIIYISPSCEGICGYTPEELMTQPGLQQEMVHPEDQTELSNHLLVDASNKDTCQLNFRIITREGETKWIAHSCRPVYSDSGELLGRRVSNRDITRLVSVEKRLKQKALHDNLTGLPNRTLLFDRLELALTSHARKNLQCAVLFIDLDNFKCINDEFGHSAGDEVLCEASRRLSQLVRASDTVARFGGDEFVVVVVELESTNEIHRIAESLIDAIQQPMPYKSQKTPLSASIGISMFPDHGSTSQELIKNADEAMYIAKQRGKNCYSCFSLDL